MSDAAPKPWVKALRINVLGQLRRLFRAPPPPEPHAHDCEGCAHLERINARYKPPEVLLATGVPLACVSLALNIAPETLRSIAKDAGLTEVQR